MRDRWKKNYEDLLSMLQNDAKREDSWGEHCRRVLMDEDELRERVGMLEHENVELRAQLDQLVMSVEEKFPGESRYETALRYIRERENLKCQTPPTDHAEREAKEAEDEART